MTESFDPTIPIEEAPTPPSTWYTDPAVLQRELDSVFRRTWQPVARLEQVMEAGDFVSGRFLDTPWVVTRAEDGALRAFFNVCRHHASEMMEGEGCAEHLTCPYHGWRYGLDGELLKAPHLGPALNFDRDQYGLVPMPVTTVGPMVAIQPVALQDAVTPPSLDALHALLEPTGYEDLVFFGQQTYDMACNWKVYVDNYLDGGYHVSVLHEGLADQLALEGYQTHVDGTLVMQRCTSAAEASGRMGTEAIYLWSHPNFMVNRYGPYMDTNLVVPLSANRARVVFDYYCEERLLEDPEALADTLRTSEQVQDEDGWICERVQRGITSPAYDTGRYAPHLEHGAHHFHKLLWEALKTDSGD